MKIHDIDNNKKGENKEYKEKLLKSLPLRQTILLDSQSPLTQTMNAIIWTCLRHTIDIVIFQCISHTQIFKKELFSSIFFVNSFSDYVSLLRMKYPDVYFPLSMLNYG